ncbi:MAG: lysylphosphatidylglycerol synthase transmembrane domain-containing protein [Nitrospiraceae bacterium]|nr:lysylphosphatidylglycerol synthase transmembrane domain-containing protein [Nitrospiraceae bacterium]
MSRNKFLLLALKLLVSAGSLYLVLVETNVSQMVATIRAIGPVAFFSASGLYILSQLGSSFRWKLLLPERFTVRRLFSLYMIGSFFSSFLPGVIGGDAVKAYYLNKDARKLSLTVASIFMDRYLGYVSLILLGMCAFPFAYHYVSGSLYQWVMPGIFILFVVGSLLFFGLQIGRRFRTVSEFYEYFVVLKGRKGVIVKAVLISMVIQVMGFMAVVILSSAMGEHIPLQMMFMFLPIIITLTTIPISISGIGVREGAFVVLFGLIGISREAATSLSLAWFFSSFVGSLPGFAFYIRHSHKPEVKGS